MDRLLRRVKEKTAKPLKRVIDVLEMKNPELTVKPGGRKTSTKNKDYVQISLEHVRPLRGFEPTNIHAMYEDLLAMEIPRKGIDLRRISKIQRKEFVVSTREEVMYDMGLKWFPETVKKCIKTTASTLQNTLKVPRKDYTVENQYCIQLKKLKRNEKDLTSSEIRADWAVVSSNTGDPLADIVGDSKRCPCFKPHLLDRVSDTYDHIDFEKEQDLVDPDTRHLIWALKQTGTYALLCKSRYSFIFTPETTTVLRFFLIKEDAFPANTVLGVEYDWFPYSNHGPGSMTLNKAIWTVTMMIQNRRHRDIVSEDKMLDLDLWYRCNVNGKSYYVHHLSEAVKDQTPPGQVKDLTEAEDDIQTTLFARCNRWVERVKRRTEAAPVPPAGSPRQQPLSNNHRAGRASEQKTKREAIRRLRSKYIDSHVRKGRLAKPIGDVLNAEGFEALVQLGLASSVEDCLSRLIATNTASKDLSDLGHSSKDDIAHVGEDESDDSSTESSEDSVA